MKLSIFTTITDPDKRGDNWTDSLACYRELADELVVVDGSERSTLRLGVHCDKIVWYEWPYKFPWEFIGQQFQRGYEAATGDWVIHADLDFLFHEKDFGKIRQALKDYPNSPAVSFYKWQFVQPDRYNLKSRLILAVNKKAFGDRIRFNGGGDLCQPTLDGKDLSLDEIPQAGVPFYNYEKLTKTKAQIREDAERMEAAYKQTFGRNLYSYDGRDAYQGLIDMMVGRYNKPQQPIGLHDHPKFIQETILKLRPDQWGYNGFGLLPYNNYARGEDYA